MTRETLAKDQEKFVLRLPDGMRDELKAVAETNKRSMNAEIVARLDESLNGVGRISQEDALAYADGVVVGVLETLMTVMGDGNLDMPKIIGRIKESANEQMKSRSYNQSVVGAMLAEALGKDQ